MDIIFHPAFYGVYDSDPAAAPGRMEAIVQELKRHPHYRFIEPEPASEEDLRRAHTARHIEVMQLSAMRYDTAILAAGGAIKTAQLACAGEPSFACIRPPGHHASSDSCWGFCFFNNMAVSLLRLMAEDRIASAFVLDFDMHRGDGNVNILGGREGITILNPAGRNERTYLSEVASVLEHAGPCDIIAASAGFDEYTKDWGGKLTTRAFRELGAMMKEFSEKRCGGRRYALLEGGYYHEDLGVNVHAFCDGFR